ncbi:MAG TPA: M20/M25/M40 family metallo-hydrolase [Pyrinomonadaceae bacterium]|jgi:Zn-dependent M28 family amino/carboxypeptidase|nr:M20/M25/M40 family metallo-hydrolase [Pyrinomonadaceae bacterium]
MKILLRVVVVIVCSAAPLLAQKQAISERNVRAEMNFLASDAMQGRGSAGPYERVAAEYIGSQFMQFGLEPVGDAGFDGKPTYVQAVAFKSRGGEDRKTYNAIGKIVGSDKTLRPQVILISAHLDHLGVRDTAPGDDKIFNGADDDASGSIAVLEIARTLASARIKPKRTVYFVCFGSEEIGGYGANYFVNNLPFAKDKLVANLEFEMMGRPDTAVKPDELWLTGYERSNLGPQLAKRGAKLVQDPHPEQQFFRRSDNYTLAKQGIIAHTVSSYGLHTDYHKVSDEIKTIDFGHMTKSINSMVAPIQWLVNSNFVPAWNEGKKP